MYLFIAIFCYGIWGFAQKFAIKTMSPLMVQLCVAYVYSSLAPVVFLYMKSTGVPMEWNTSGIIWSTVAVLSGIFGSLALLTALQSSAAGLTSSIASTYPLITLVLGVVFLGEIITVQKFMGVVTIIVGLALISR